MVFDRCALHSEELTESVFTFCYACRKFRICQIVFSKHDFVPQFATAGFWGLVSCRADDASIITFGRSRVSFCE
jgi:hypothetical protein